jgi:hypothetical protein
MPGQKNCKRRKYVEFLQAMGQFLPKLRFKLRFVATNTFVIPPKKFEVNGFRKIKNLKNKWKLCQLLEAKTNRLAVILVSIKTGKRPSTNPDP